MLSFIKKLTSMSFPSFTLSVFSTILYLNKTGSVVQECMQTISGLIMAAVLILYQYLNYLLWSPLRDPEDQQN